VAAGDKQALLVAKGSAIRGLVQGGGTATARMTNEPAGTARATPRGSSRRSSVPSWDEIMFGTSRQPE